MTTEDKTEPCTRSESPTDEKAHKTSKRGILYLSSIPPYMNVTKIREIFGQYGKVGRVYLQLGDKGTKDDKKKKKRKKIAKKFTEGWIEYEKKCVAKRVVALLNNTQVSTRKKSKHYDYTWNIKYLSNFKWTHLHERLAYERAAKNKKLKAEIQMSKKKTNFFTGNLGGNKMDSVNKEYENMEEVGSEAEMEEDERQTREEMLSSLF